MVGVELDGVRKDYAETVALADVDLYVRDGEFFTLLGPSGCGKTTTLRLLAGFEAPTAGTVRFGGDPVTGVPPEDRGVGVVFQSYALFPHMSVRENVGYGLRFADPPGGVSRRERVDDLLELVDLGGMGDRRPEELSGGQQQRVALARALAPEPRLLLLDEPMSALDARLRERLRMQVKTIQADLGITTVYVTHDQEEALAVSDRVAVLRDGRVEQVGTPREVYREPRTRFVASFVGDNNVFDGEVTAVSANSTNSANSAGSAGSPGSADTDAPPGETNEGGTGAVDVAVDGYRFRVRAPDRDPAVGDRVTFCVRPEALRVVAEDVAAVQRGRADDGTDAPNRFAATVEGAEFLGETTRVHLDWRGREVLVRTDRDLAGEVALSFDPAEARVVDAE